MSEIMENQRLKAKDVKDTYSIVDLLSHLGYEPAKRVGNETLYLSMLRDSDTTPSFSVNEKRGTWFDFGESKGGTIIDFGLCYWPRLSFNEVMEKIIETCSGNRRIALCTNNYKRQPVTDKQPNYALLDIKEIGNNSVISGYLSARGVGTVAKGRIKEIYYYVEGDDKKRSNFFAAGWQNEQGGWEVRNLNFKGCLGHKAISFIPNSEKRLSVFEGYFDYLSWLTENPFAPDSVLVLNSLSLLQPAIGKAEGFVNISVYFDNDPSGRQATTYFLAALPWTIDRASIYKGYNDYNDRIVAEQANNQLNR